MIKQHKFKDIIALSVPVFFGYITLGMAFGIILVTKGFEWWLAPIFSILVYAGSMQFLAIGLILANVSLLTVFVTTLFVNFRHIFYGISLFHLLPNTKYGKLYFIFSITDESYSLLTSNNVTKAEALELLAINHFYWILGSTLGALLARYGIDKLDLSGIDFTLTSLFVVLFIEQARQNNRLVLIVIAIFSCLFATIISPNQFLLVSITTASILLVANYYLNHKQAYECVDEYNR